MTISPEYLILTVLALALAPLLPGVINKTKAFFAGRQGPPVTQLYYDLAKLLRKSTVYSRTSGWPFRMGPLAGLAAVAAALLVAPLGTGKAPFAFEGDLILFAYLLGVSRFCTILAALDTGSAFEGMGASREAWFSALAEPVLLVSLAAVGRGAETLSLSGMAGAHSWGGQELVLALSGAAVLAVFLTENSRIPVDDPNTHLELTMVHEVMVLDHGGPDLGLIEYASSLKLWAIGAVLVSFINPWSSCGAFWGCASALLLLFALAVLTGVIESMMARLRLVRVPHFLAGAGALAALSAMLALR